MLIVRTIKELRSFVKDARLNGKSIGFVPTMGFLHDGHLSLMKQSIEENDLSIASIFVNPTQFGPNEDLDAYPRDFERDVQLMESVGMDIVFFPAVEVMYSEGASTSIEVEGTITKRLCGASRDGHFKGVTTIVGKLFNLVTPDRAYFGQKDAQQVAVIEKMVRDLNFNVEIIPCPIVREADGLALSSRNVYLNETERKEALVLSQALNEAKQMILDGEKDALKIQTMMIDKIKAVDSAKIDYVEVVSAETLEPIQVIEGDVLMAVAVWVGKPRLIDNIRLEV